MDPGRQTLSQQQQKHFWSKMIFEQQNQKKFPENKLGKTKLGRKNFSGKKLGK